ncbi:MAG: hypothetical protein J0H74_06975 [Chitinophagaceae bacterium]|nr:hypothetical protein [Chitinophagaceae bacterium]
MIEDQIEIPLSKVKLSKLLVFSVLFLAGGLWVMIANPQTNNPVFSNPMAKAFASYGATIMGLLGIYWFTRKLFDPGTTIMVQDQNCLCPSFDRQQYFLRRTPWCKPQKSY